MNSISIEVKQLTDKQRELMKKHTTLICTILQNHSVVDRLLILQLAKDAICFSEGIENYDIKLMKGTG